MSLNYLLHQHQVALMRADAACCGEVSAQQRRAALGYAREIEALVQPQRKSLRPLVPVT